VHFTGWSEGGELKVSGNFNVISEEECCGVVLRGITDSLDSMAATIVSGNFDIHSSNGNAGGCSIRENLSQNMQIISANFSISAGSTKRNTCGVLLQETAVGSNTKISGIFSVENTGTESPEEEENVYGVCAEECSGNLEVSSTFTLVSALIPVMGVYIEKDAQTSSNGQPVFYSNAVDSGN
jgi:hypothetical protein